MNLDELYAVQSKERKRDSLQKLRPSFYQEVGEYIAELEAERDRAAAAATDPFSAPEVSRLTDEIETARDVVEAIYERRMGKLVKQASLAAAGMSADEEGLTAEERDLFEDLVSRIETNNDRVLDVLNGANGATNAGGSDQGKPSTRTAADAQSPSGESSAPSQNVSAAADESPIPPRDAPAPEEEVPVSPEETTDTITAAEVMGETEERGTSISDDEPVREDASDRGEKSIRDDEPASDGGTRTVGESSSSETNIEADKTDGGERSTVDRVTVKITHDVGSILGVDDREYTLSSDDVVTLPEQNATPLLDREVAEPLE